MNTPNGYAEIQAMFGDPRGPDGTLNPVWEAKNIKQVRPPAGWQLYYQSDKGPLKVSSVKLHRAVEASFTQVLTEVWRRAQKEAGPAASDDEVRAWLRARRLDLHGGAFNYRAKRSGSGDLSLHSWGIALDWDPANNPMRKPLTCTLPDWWYDIWHANGWHDGRGFATPDPMHVQFATGA